MARVISTNKAASDHVNGVRFTRHHTGHMVSEEINAEQAKQFVRVPGYRLHDEKEKPAAGADVVGAQAGGDAGAGGAGQGDAGGEGDQGDAGGEGQGDAAGEPARKPGRPPGSKNKAAAAAD